MILTSLELHQALFASVELNVVLQDGRRCDAADRGVPRPPDVSCEASARRMTGDQPRAAAVGVIDSDEDLAALAHW